MKKEGVIEELSVSLVLQSFRERAFSSFDHSQRDLPKVVPAARYLVRAQGVAWRRSQASLEQHFVLVKHDHGLLERQAVSRQFSSRESGFARHMQAFSVL